MYECVFLAEVNYFLVPAGAVATATWTVASLLAMMITHAIAVTSGAITSVAVTSGVSPTKAGIRRDLAGFQLEIQSLLTHFGFEIF